MIPEFFAKIGAAIWAWIATALMVIFLCVSIAQTIRIDGISLLGWHLTDGYITQVTGLAARIDDPKTGYIARLATSERNSDGLLAQIKDQNKLIAALSAAGAKKKSAAGAQVAAAQKDAAAGAAAMASFVGSAPSGGSVCARVIGVDGRFLEMLKQ